MRTLSLTIFCLCLPLLAQGEPILGPEDSTSLFDGATLKGWTPKGGRYDGTARWTVEDGVIVGRQGPNRSGGLLYTEQSYGDFIVSFETMIDWPFDSGLFVRMVPRPGPKGGQITLDYRPGGQVGAVYADGFLAQNKTAIKKWKKGEWNRVTVRCSGPDMHLTAWLNGERISQYRLPSGTAGYAREGRIGIQVHGGASTPETQAARFRNLRLRELPDFDPARFASNDHGQLILTERARAEGWTDLLAGGLDAWSGTPEGAYRHDDGVLHFSNGDGGYLRTKQVFRDFQLRLDFRPQFMANSGVFFRGTPKNPGQEIQILDDFNWEKETGSKLGPYQFSGGLYFKKPADIRTALRPMGRWNTYEITVRDSHVEARLNGHLIHDVDLNWLEQKPRPLPREGWIALQRHAPKQAKNDPIISFRNVFVRPLPSRD